MGEANAYTEHRHTAQRWFHSSPPPPPNPHVGLSKTSIHGQKSENFDSYSSQSSSHSDFIVQLDRQSQSGKDFGRVILFEVSKADHSYFVELMVKSLVWSVNVMNVVLDQ